MGGYLRRGISCPCWPFYFSLPVLSGTNCNRLLHYFQFLEVFTVLATPCSLAYFSIAAFSFDESFWYLHSSFFLPILQLRVTEFSIHLVNYGCTFGKLELSCNGRRNFSSAISNMCYKMGKGKNL